MPVMVRPMGNLWLKGRVGHSAGTHGQVLSELGSPVGLEVACLSSSVPELSLCSRWH